MKIKLLIFTKRRFTSQEFGWVELKYIYLLLLLSAMPLPVQSQENQTLISGKLVQAETGDPVPYAHLILERDGVTRTATSDTSGVFEINKIPYGIYRLTISSIGYQTLRIQEIAIEHQNTEPMVVKLTPAITSIDEIVVRADPNITAADRLSGGYAMTAEEVRRFPATFYTAIRMAQRTVRSSDEIFSDQLPSVLKTNFRVYYKMNHSKRYSLIGLDLTNVLNRQNVSYRYYDPYLDRIVDKTQLGLIPMLSYVVRI